MNVNIESVYENYFWGNEKIRLTKLTPVGRNEKEYTFQEWVDVHIKQCKDDKEGVMKWR